MKAKRTHKKVKRRIGRGNGSGSGKTAGKGHKGQKARSDFRQRVGFEGGQNPLYRRLPKRGFNHNAFRTEYRIINLTLLESLGEKAVSPETLVQRGILNNLKRGLKVLGNGEIKTAMEVKAHQFSESARAKIEKAGGKVIVIKAESTKKEASA